MLSKPSARAARQTASAVRNGSLLRPCAPVSRPLVRASAQEEGFFSDTFRAALANALERDQSSAADLYSTSYSSSSRDHGYSRFESSNGSSSYARPPPPVETATAGPMLQILATALGQSRATLERLQVEEAELEALIQRERKQVERLEWLLEKVQQDYAYFDHLQKRFEQQDSNGSSGSRW